MFQPLRDAGLQFDTKLIEFLVNKGISSILVLLNYEPRKHSKKHSLVGKLLTFEYNLSVNVLT